MYTRMLENRLYYMVTAIVCGCVASAILILHGMYYHMSFLLLISTGSCIFQPTVFMRIVSLLWFWFGGVGTMVVALFLYSVAYILCMQWTWRKEGERIIALCLVGPILCSMSFTYHVDVLRGCIPGGILGYVVSTAIAWCTGNLAGLFLYITWLSILVIIVRLWHMSVVHALVMIAIRWYHWSMKQRLLFHIQRIIHFVYARLCVVGRTTLQYIVAITGGTLFERASMTIPDDYEKQVERIKEFHARVHAIVQDQERGTAPDNVIAEDVLVDAMVQYTSACRDDAVSSNSSACVIKDAKQYGDISTKYQLPDVTGMAQQHDQISSAALTRELQAKAVLLQEKLHRFGVNGEIVAIKRGPLVTLYEYQPSIDTKLSKIVALEDDLALALQAVSIRIIAPIPGREVVGFEVSNVHAQPVLLASLFASDVWKQTTHMLPLALGVDIIGTPVVADLAAMPHVLIAGSTGSGKSVALNTMLVSLMCRRTPDELKLIIIDPKRLEFAAYADVPYLLFPIVTNPRQAAPVLQWVVAEMERRYECMARAAVRTIRDYNYRASTCDAQVALPWIVVLIDELSDLMMTAGRDIEDAVARLAQMARAAGIHLIVATQRPSVDVITGLIKVNFPSRISFRVTSRVDSRTILDCGGAEKLLGRGDMLFFDSHSGLLRRLHGAYVADAETQEIILHSKSQRTVTYHELGPILGAHSVMDDYDILYPDILSYLEQIDEISISELQRRFKIGFNRSAKIIEYLEKQGRIMPPEGSKARKIIH
jgi:hypothetical protein